MDAAKRLLKGTHCIIAVDWFDKKKNGLKAYPYKIQLS